MFFLMLSEWFTRWFDKGTDGDDWEPPVTRFG